MSGYKFKISFIIFLVSLFSGQAFSQQISYSDSLTEDNSRKINLKPVVNYYLGSSFIAVPHSGSVTGFTISPVLSLPLSPKLSIDGRVIAGRYYSAHQNFIAEDPKNGAFNGLSVYGAASYHVNPQLTLYGSGTKQLAGASPYFPKSSYSVGSTYNFGSFSIGLAVKVSKWNNSFGPFQINDYQGFYSPFQQGPGAFNPFGQ
jgi:hypothetical protein